MQRKCADLEIGTFIKHFLEKIFVYTSTSKGKK